MTARKICCICSQPNDPEICDDCWQNAQHQSAQRQDEALAAGRRAANENRPVIWIHGRAYTDPDDTREHEETPFPWDIWDDGHPENPT